MKAIVRTRYGTPDVLHLAEIEKPTPADNQVLVTVHAASLNKSDWYYLSGPFLVRILSRELSPKRQVLGSDIAGRVEAVGRSVTRFQPGDEVFGCGRGGLAEYTCAREEYVAPKPANLTFEEMAAAPVAAITALQGLRKGGIQSGQRVLVYGASGGVGTFAVQIAKSFGAEVTAVCSTRNMESARSLGADLVVDYTKEDYTKKGHRYDLIVGVNGRRSILAHRRALSDTGVYVLAGSSRPIATVLETLMLGPLVSNTGSKRVSFMGIAKINRQDLDFLAELMRAGRVKSAIDRRYPLSEAAEAFRYLGEGHARGKVIIAMPHVTA